MQVYIKKLEQAEAKLANYITEIDDMDGHVIKLISETANTQTALTIVQKAVQDTQNLLADRLSSVVTLALTSLFDDPYTFHADFVQRRNSTECDLLFEKDGELMEPLKECGYGAVDTAAMALRVGVWGMETNTAPIFVLDEPFRNLDKKKHSLASQMIKSLSDDLGIQFIIVTHTDELAQSADKCFKISMIDGISTVKENF